MTQSELATRLSLAGWGITQHTVTRIEKDAERDVARVFTNEQIEVFAMISKIDRWICYFWAGRLPPQIYQVPEDGLSEDNLLVGLGLLAASVGGINIGPAISHDVAAMMGMLGSSAEEVARAELHALEGAKVTLSPAQRDRAGELSQWIKQRHKAPAKDEEKQVRGILHAWGEQAVKESRA